MQLNLKISLLLAIIALTMGTKLKVNKFEAKTMGDCPDTSLVLELASDAQTAEDYVHKAAVETKANQQVAAARALLDTPNARSKAILKQAATQLKSLLEKDKIKKDAQWTHAFNRSIYGGIKNAEGLNSNQFKDTFDQLAWVQNVANDQNTSGPDRAGVLALLGDIGTAVMDCKSPYTNTATKAELANYVKTIEPKAVKTEDECGIKKKVDDDKLNKAYCAIKETVRRTFFADKTKVVFDKATKAALTERGGSAIAPRKKADAQGNKDCAERGMMKKDFADQTVMKDGCKSIFLKTRSGLLNKGDNITSSYKANWPWQKIPKEYFNCAEPWAGHYSGSILEVLLMLDIVSQTVDNDDTMTPHEPFATFDVNKKPKEPADLKKKFDHKGQKCKAALAGAFLISIGYHSAIEIKPTIWAFLGKKMPKILSRFEPENCDLTSSDSIVKLFKSCTGASDPKDNDI